MSKNSKTTSLTPSELAYSLGVSARTINRWTKIGCPCEKTTPFALGATGTRPRYNLEKVKEWVAGQQRAKRKEKQA